MTTAAAVNEAKAQSHRVRGCLFYVKRAVFGLLLLIVGLITTGFVFETIMRAGDAQRYPAPGQLLAVSGGTMHLHCTGEGSPTVILETGAANFSLSWWSVQPELSATTRVCSYDRFGSGWSTAATTPRTPDQITQELHELLTVAEIEGPYVMVGWSFGSYYTQMFAIRHPEDVVGMVWVDGRPWEGLPPLTSEEREQMLRDMQPGYALYVGLTRSGIGRILATNFFPYTPADIATEMAAFAPSGLETSLYEWADGQADNLELTSHNDLGDLPLVVLGAEVPNGGLEQQQLMANYSSNSRLQIVEGTDHALLWERPDVVIQAVRDVIVAAQTGEPLAQ